MQVTVDWRGLEVTVDVDEPMPGARYGGPDDGSYHVHKAVVADADEWDSWKDEELDGPALDAGTEVDSTDFEFESEFARTVWEAVENEYAEPYGDAEVRP